MNYHFTKVLFIDIETAAIKPNFEDVDPVLQECFRKKFEKELPPLTQISIIHGRDDDWQSIWEAKAPLYPEYGKIVCISIGRFIQNPEDDVENPYIFKTHTFLNEFGEEQLLRQFIEAFIERWGGHVEAMCAHNGKMFDYPWIIKHLILHGIPLPPAFKVYGKKPWDLDYFLDTFEQWKMLGYESASLRTLANIFGLEDPKSNMDGVMVGQMILQDLIPWKEITAYCEGDVKTLANVFKKIFQL